ncbi:MAG: sensor histidine kinase [Clostridiales bacterium]
MKKKLFKFLSNTFNNLKLKNKLLFSYFILIVMLLSLLTFISYYQVSNFLNEQIIYSSKHVFDQTNSFIDFKLVKILDIVNFISLDSNLNTIINKNSENYNLVDQLRDEVIISDFLKSYQKSKDIDNIKLYVNDEFLFSKENVNIFNMKQVKDNYWYKNLLNEPRRVIFIPPSQNNSRLDENNKISIVKGIVNTNDYSEIIAVLQIDILENDIKKIIKNANATEKSVSFITNSFGTIFTSSNDSFLENVNIDKDFYFNLANNSNWSSINIKEKKHIIGCRSIENTDWYVVSIIPYDEILKSSTVIFNQMIILLFLLAIIAYIFAYFISLSSTKRITKLIKSMESVQNGDMEAIIPSNSRDEIGELIDKFNFMVKEINKLIQDKYQSGLDVKNLELKALQAQINPHFLYNSLDLINWTAIKNDVPEISSLVQTLAKFYKLSLNKGKEIVSIKDEIEHVLSYISIQNMRFENRIKIINKIEEKIYDYKILKLLLQPIVENSILHGIIEKESKSGTITFTGKIIDEIIYIQIKDNGIGMTEEKLNRVFDDTKESIHGYSMKNINSRIKLYYGRKYGITIKTKLNKGTTVLVKIPT